MQAEGEGGEEGAEEVSTSLSVVGRGKVATVHKHASTIDEHAEVGGECGVCLGNTFTGFQEGDVIELIEEKAL